MRLPDLLNELAVAHGDGTLKKVIKAYQKIDLLILDEFLLSPVSTEQTRELLEIIEARSVKGSVIFCTQFEPKGWYSRIGNDCDATICEAIIDRIIHNSYEVMLDGRISMRERHGISDTNSKPFTNASESNPGLSASAPSGPNNWKPYDDKNEYAE